jgi:hypothetical protein
MSNRAEVALAIKIEAYKETITKEVKEALQECDAVYKIGEEHYIFFWSSAKWVDTFKDVKTIHEYLNTALMDEDFGLKVLWPPFENDCDDDKGQPSLFDIFVKHEIDLPEDKTELSKEDFFASNAEKFINNIS